MMLWIKTAIFCLTIGLVLYENITWQNYSRARPAGMTIIRARPDIDQCEDFAAFENGSGPAVMKRCTWILYRFTKCLFVRQVFISLQAEIKCAAYIPDKIVTSIC